MSQFYIEYPDQLIKRNYIHPFFKEYASNGSLTIYGHNINYGFPDDIEIINHYTIQHIKNMLKKDIIQGELIEIKLNGEKSYGWWSVVK